MIARLAAGDDSLGSTTVTVLLLLYIGPDLLRHKNGRLAKIVCFHQRMWVSLDSASSKCFVFRIICILWLNVTFDALTQFSFFSMRKRDNTENRCWLAPSSYNSGVNDMPPSLDTTTLLFVHLAFFWTWHFPRVGVHEAFKSAEDVASFEPFCGHVQVWTPWLNRLNPTVFKVAKSSTTPVNSISVILLTCGW